MANNVTTQTSTLATVPTSTKVATFEVGTNGHIQGLTDGGSATNVAHTAGKATDTVVKAAAAMLCNILVTATGTTDLEIYDNASAGSGSMVAVVPANTPKGTLIKAQMPCANGITTKGAANTPAVTISYF